MSSSKEDFSVSELLRKRQELLPNPIRFVPAERPQNASSRLDTSSLGVGKQIADGVMLYRPTEEDFAAGFKPAAKQLFPAQKLKGHIKWRAPSPVGCGLVNMGNTCYVNSVLQCLTYTPVFANYVASRQHSATCILKNAKARNGNKIFCLFCVFEGLIPKWLRLHKGVFCPKPIVSRLRFFCRRYFIGQQQDAHEFMMKIMESLQKSAIAPFKKIKDDRIKETSVIHKMFGGYLRSQIRCKVCSNLSNTFEPILDFSLEIHSSNSLDRCFQHYTKTEVMKGEDSVTCERCAKKTAAEKRLTIFEPPNVLSVHLKRFSFHTNGGFGGKVKRKINYEEKVDITKYMSRSAELLRTNQRETYSLYAVLVHAGHSVHSGHYYAYVRNSNGVWYLMDDDEVQTVNKQIVLNQQAYMLFYTRDHPFRSPKTNYPLSKKNGHHLNRSPSSKSIPKDLRKPFVPPRQKKINGFGSNEKELSANNRGKAHLGSLKGKKRKALSELNQKFKRPKVISPPKAPPSNNTNGVKSPPSSTSVNTPPTKSTSRPFKGQSKSEAKTPKISKPHFSPTKNNAPPNTPKDKKSSGKSTISNGTSPTQMYPKFSGKVQSPGSRRRFAVTGVLSQITPLPVASAWRPPGFIGPRNPGFVYRRTQKRKLNHLQPHMNGSASQRSGKCHQKSDHKPQTQTSEHKSNSNTKNGVNSGSLRPGAETANDKSSEHHPAKRTKLNPSQRSTQFQQSSSPSASPLSASPPPASPPSASPPSASPPSTYPPSTSPPSASPPSVSPPSTSPPSASPPSVSPPSTSPPSASPPSASHGSKSVQNKLNGGSFERYDATLGLEVASWSSGQGSSLGANARGERMRGFSNQRKRDILDIEYDLGRIKKVKTRRNLLKTNSFQKHASANSKR